MITMAKLRMAHASTHGARKPLGPIFLLLRGQDYRNNTYINTFKMVKEKMFSHVLFHRSKSFDHVDYKKIYTMKT